MKISLNYKVLVICLLIIGSLIFFLNQNKVINKNEKITIENNLDNYNSNTMKNVSYVSKDANGNTYKINAEKGEIDLSNPNIIFLTNVKSKITSKNSADINITSNYGKYNIINNETIFSKDVKIKYLENIINGDYLDFSIKRNSMIISKNVTYVNEKNKLISDVIEIDLKTKDTKIFMFDKNKNVSVKSMN